MYKFLSLRVASVTGLFFFDLQKIESIPSFVESRIVNNCSILVTKENNDK